MQNNNMKKLCYIHIDTYIVSPLILGVNVLTYKYATKYT